MSFSSGVFPQQVVTNLEGSGMSSAGPNFDFSRQHNEQLSARRHMQTTAPIFWEAHPRNVCRLNWH